MIFRGFLYYLVVGVELGFGFRILFFRINVFLFCFVRLVYVGDLGFFIGEVEFGS